MRNRKYKKKNQSRFIRVERKCDRILAELLIIRQTVTANTDLDITIDRLHKAAQVMRTQCARERNIIERMCNRIINCDDC